MSIFITGSSSCLLSVELATKLTGHSTEPDMCHLTYEGYLGMKQLLALPLQNDLRKLTSVILEGGFPYAPKLITCDAIDSLIKKRNSIRHVNILQFMKEEKNF